MLMMEIMMDVVMKMMPLLVMMLLIRCSIFRLQLSGRPSKV